MGRKKKTASLPPLKLFKRGSKDILYFRAWINGKDKWFSTKTSDPEEAARIASAYQNGEIAVKSKSQKERSTVKLANDLSESIIENITGKKVVKTPVDKAYDLWVAHSRGYKDLAVISKNFTKTVFDKFAAWCVQQHVAHVEDVNQGITLQYSKHLWDTGITPKTYNEHIRVLSKIFSTIDTISPLPFRNPFDKRIIERKRKTEFNTVGHMALEPDQLKSVISEAAKAGVDYRDLFVIGSQTGMRLKDTALLEWGQMDKNGFINIKPHKTQRTGNESRIPVSKTVKAILDGRLSKNRQSSFVLPDIAQAYQASPESVAVKTKRIFERALGGKEKTQIKPGAHRKNKTCFYSFHSFRTTYMSLLAHQDVSIRDAMRIMGWNSMEMIKVYERELENAKRDADKRALSMVDRIKEFATPIPEAAKPLSKLTPTKESLHYLFDKYSNITIGRIYDISEAAVRKWLNKFGLKRTKRIESGEIPKKELEKIRTELSRSKDGVHV